MKLYPLIVTAIMLSSCQSTDPVSFSSFDEYPVYEGNDLGLQYHSDESIFKVWAPTADAMRIQFYSEALGGEAIRQELMQKKEKGVWEIRFLEDLKGLYYTFQIQQGEQWLDEVPDPYAKAVGTNGKRAQVIDFKETNPSGWENDQRPALAGYQDIIIYELHVRDLSTHESSGIQQKGKFLGLAESETLSPDGLATGIDHLKELGITHLHLLPSYDYLSIDESKLEENKFNWGYDPQNYNVPEGSYSTNPADGKARILEFKQAIKALHDAGIRVIMDVVYNHTGATEASNFNQLVPDYYYRQDSTGGFSNASACGNETASDRPMMRKFIVESVKYWATEYHIDGFRFDLMGIHDMETMNAVSRALRAIDPSIFVYGEGWTAGASPLADERKALKASTHLMDHVAAFSDDIRDGLKGHVFTFDAKGFVSGQAGLDESVKFGILASTQHPQVNYEAVNYSNAPWAKSPLQTITYVSCHDNHTLWDRLTLSCPDASEEEKKEMQKLAGAVVLTSQGISFLHAGVELCRTKQGHENSFESPDSINQIDWSWKAKNKDVFEYFKGLIQLRKNHPAFRMTTTDLLNRHLKFLDVPDSNLIAYTLSEYANGDVWKTILVVFNGNRTAKTLSIPDGNWTIVLDNKQYKEEGIRSFDEQTLSIPASSAMVLINN